ncbi:hypothetical protein AVEN_166120-1, partial [Araneus ventricosus]
MLVETGNTMYHGKRHSYLLPSQTLHASCCSPPFHAYLPHLCTYRPLPLLPQPPSLLQAHSRLLRCFFIPASGEIPPSQTAY